QRRAARDRQRWTDHRHADRGRSALLLLLIVEDNHAEPVSAWRCGYSADDTARRQTEPRRYRTDIGIKSPGVRCNAASGRELLAVLSTLSRGRQRRSGNSELRRLRQRCRSRCQSGNYTQPLAKWFHGWVLWSGHQPVYLF